MGFTGVGAGGVVDDDLGVGPAGPVEVGVGAVLGAEAEGYLLVGVGGEGDPSVVPALLLEAAPRVEVAIQEGVAGAAGVCLNDEARAVADRLVPGGGIEGDSGLKVGVGRHTKMKGYFRRRVHEQPAPLVAANPLELGLEVRREERRTGA